MLHVLPHRSRRDHSHLVATLHPPATLERAGGPARAEGARLNSGPVQIQEPTRGEVRQGERVEHTGAVRSCRLGDAGEGPAEEDLWEVRSGERDVRGG